MRDRMMASDFDRAATAPVERIARVLAAHELSRNADGEMSSAGTAVDMLWPEHADAALAVLRTMRDQPPPLPEVLLFDAYLLREVPQLIAEGGEGPRDWGALLNCEIEIGSQKMPARQFLAEKFAEDLPELQRAIGDGRMPFRQVSVDIVAADAGGPVKLSLRGDWRVFRARVEAWLVNGSYSFTDKNFHGNVSTPSIDMWSSDPGPGWEAIAVDDIGAGNTVKMFMMAGDVSSMLETPLFEAAAIVQ